MKAIGRARGVMASGSPLLREGTLRKGAHRVGLWGRRKRM
jgi:hypothetical protein